MFMSDCILGFERLHYTVLKITGDQWSVTANFKGLTKQKANASDHFDQPNCLLYIQFVCFTNFMEKFSFPFLIDCTISCICINIL